ncbi:MAG TPA: (d)CMP kinase [Salinimicrobium sp.]|nr:(d)CMP kinase [Salinimicrobium sp.]
MKKIIIAIDGFSSTGKSTVAKQLARHLNYIYVDTGAMYRAVAFFAMQKDFISEEKFDKEDLVNHLDQVKIHFEFNPEVGFAEVFLNDEKIEKQIRTLEVSQYVSQVAAIPEVRRMLVKQQQEMGKFKGIVMDGRDIGTVVFPDAELKIFMTASSEQRALRRFKELNFKGDDVSYEEVLENIEQRDYLDTTREDSPLVKASDAIEIDNSTLTIDDQLQKILNIVKQAIES